MNRLDVRTAERNEALSVAAAAEGRIKVRLYTLSNVHCLYKMSMCRVMVVCAVNWGTQASTAARTR
jgi:hypothetical protein